MFFARLVFRSFIGWAILNTSSFAMEHPTSPKKKDTVGNTLFKDYVETTDTQYWTEAEEFSKKLKKLTVYAESTYGKDSDMSNIMTLINNLYHRHHKDAPNLTAYSDTLWAITMGMSLRVQLLHERAKEGLLDPFAAHFGSKNGIDINRAPIDEDLDILMLAMIFSKLTATLSDSKAVYRSIYSRV